MTADEVRARLSALGAQRAQHERHTGVLADEIKRAVADAKSCKVPVSEAARLLQMDRSALYRTYLS